MGILRAYKFRTYLDMKRQKAIDYAVVEELKTYLANAREANDFQSSEDVIGWQAIRTK